MTTKIAGMPEPVQIEEKFSRRMAIAAMSNFRNLPEAVLELVDNAVDKFDGRYGGKQLTISIELTQQRIVVENIGGRGMGPQELQAWLEWGESDTVEGIGHYGQGGKAAMGYLGNAWRVRCKKYDDDIVWEVRDDNWRDTSVDRKSLQAIAIERDKKHHGQGYCRFEIRQLVKRRLNLSKLQAHLSNVYRLLLEDGKLTIQVNDEEVRPFDLPLYAGFPKQEFRETTDLGWSCKGWIGRLKRDRPAKGAIAIHGGMRLTRRGRLICDGEYFGHPDFRYKASLNTLIGEVELGKMPVLPNKTDFDRDSEAWEAAQVVMYALLKPHVEDLLKQADEVKVTKEERQRVREVRTIMIRALDWLSKQGDVNPFALLGTGRKPPEPREPQLKREPQPPQEPQPQRIKKPRTPPPVDPVGILKRLGMMPDWDIDVLDTNLRSTWQESGAQHKLIINKKFPLYELRKGDDLYIAETAALELARADDEEQIFAKDYSEHVNRIIAAFCTVYSA